MCVFCSSSWMANNNDNIKENGYQLSTVTGHPCRFTGPGETVSEDRK